MVKELTTIDCNTNNMYLRLPVPDIKDDTVLQHSYKQSQRRLRPPKLKYRHSESILNRSISSISTTASAYTISFHGGDGELECGELPPSPIYDRSLGSSYFEQCFANLAKIGEGSFGEVFKVRSKNDGLLYAIKMTKQLLRSETYRNERLEEVRRYEQFSGHENCVRFHCAWEENDRLYMQMELCNGNLEDYLERCRHIPEEKIWSVLLDLLLALKSLHDRNLIHLDIKLDNVLIGDDTKCKLADFGLVIDIDRANRSQATEGDSRYIAPEIMQGNFSKAADVFSLGVAILELSCYLNLPSNGPLWQQLRSGVLPQDFIKSISCELQAIIRQMMTPEPSERPTVDELLVHRKLQDMRQRRNRWKLVTKAKKTIRKTRRIAWSQCCRFKYAILRFFASLFTKFKYKYTSGTTKIPVICNTVVSSTPTTGNLKSPYLNFNLNENSLDDTNQSQFLKNKIINSTPVNCSKDSFRSRKDLTKINFNLMNESTVSQNDSGSSCIFEEVDPIFYEKKLLNTSTMMALRKKLFADDIP